MSVLAHADRDAVAAGQRSPAGPAAMSHRHAVGSSSARGLIFTILGEYVLPASGVVWTSAMIDAMARLDVEEKATRQALMRTAADGWLTAERVGRRTRWRLTPSADRLLTEGSERIYSFGDRRAGWDRDWLLVLARIPEAGRPARHALRSRLTRAGFGNPAPGVWISTHAERLAEVEQALAEAGLAGEAQIFRGHHADGQLPVLVGQAWDLATVRRMYEDFITAFGSVSPADPLAEMVELVHAWRRFPWTDPDLPSELLPPGWPRPRAAALFRRLHAQWAAQAAESWQAIG
ncbi:MAG TPA: PaaX family transcriptional regulator C-terminal domain-containing protein [Streptosporangiaceae bacterium]|nr:PaaX family transcriptional regulator C-terminal domain-containing protein [Streptosporangiaceae bacterium]